MDNMLFYGGIITAGIAAVAAVIILLAYKLSMAKLKLRLNAEYGEEKKPAKNNSERSPQKEN